VNDRQHDRHFHQNPHNGRERRAGLKSEQGDGSRDRKFEEVTCPDQCGWPRHAPFDAENPVQPIGKSRIEIDLYDDWHGQQRDDDRLSYDLLPLQPEQKQQRQQQRAE
jgi:hypothetical protein